ncbi:VCBS repeat-containing protein [Panacibacter sp. DH6]|uniref:VCBS repeat-containing protein n=1 Tax=Panacibacter microcysteis TaxID=2793269 RepID=A0A931E697_9BACT|nr:VCBS repeat-containing protein [Panacibacter microcysteis]MBG9376040.1 VCBS repeat-containing protein [Panacibacter microcysteis]
MRIFHCCILLLLFVLNACRDDHSTLFTRLDKSATGINFNNTLFEDGPLNVSNYIYFYNGGGVAVGDINNDGLQDILFTGNMVRNRLFLNKGNLTFEDITKQSGVDQMQGWCTGATMADINGDGKLDIYICRSADINPERRKNLLFINNGDLTFKESAAQYGLADNGYSTQAGFFDYDKDGDLDCFIINHSLQKYTAGVQDNPELRNERNPDFATKLYRNDHNHFTNVSDSAGITSNVLTFGLGLAISDVNNDGWQDVYVSNDFNEPDYLFINNRNGTFTESLGKCMDEISLYSMGSDVADYNNDGYTDLVTLDMMPEDNRTQKMHSGAENFDKFQILFDKGFYYQYSRNMLQKNNGDGTFSEVAQLAGVSNTDWSWTALFADYDNDGNKDLFVSNGYVKDYTDMDFLRYSVDRVIRNMNHDSVDGIPEYIQKMPTNVIPNYIYKNNGDGTFTKQTKEWGFEKPVVSAGSAYADLDNDGDLDLIVNNSNDYADVYRNNSEATKENNFLKINLQGSAGNSRGIGAKIKVFCKDTVYYQEQSPVRGFQTSVDPVLNFGIGRHKMADSVIVIWPDDNMQKLTNINANTTLIIKSIDAKDKFSYVPAAVQKIISTDTLAAISHTENGFNDFTSQLLLINYLSRQGPCIQQADLNGDGLSDLFTGGAKGFPSKIFIQQPNGTFAESVQPALAADAGSEDVAAAFFDADNDGDADLYVGSGGYEFEQSDSLLQDRLYINDGKAGFAKASNALPRMPTSTGCVKAADIDGDGDVDIFTGGRLVPGMYPVTPRSYVLLNDGKGNFADATDAVGSTLKNIGMVTDAAWVDVNADKRPDLVVAGEWMPVKVFINQNGKLADASKDFIKFESSGWWNKIYAADMDADGDSDLILGNIGLNAQFRANAKQPLSIYYKDFDNNGSVDPVFCYYIQGVSYPAASRDDLADQLPFIKKKFLEYKGYSTATINDIFTKEQLQDANILQAGLMETIYLENQGAKGFVMHKLPAEAQYAPVYGMVALDANKDNKKDLLLLGNNTWTRIKFGRYSANHGILLTGDGKGNFTYVPQPASGLNIRGNVRSLSAIKTKNGEAFVAGINNSKALLLHVNN